MKKSFAHLRYPSALVAVLALTLVPAAFGQSGAADERKAMRVSIEVGGTSVTAVLEDSPTSRDFVTLLPLDLEFESYGNNEKIAYPPRKLTTEGAGSFGNQAPGDFVYFASWGNIIVYYGEYEYWPGLIRLGHIEGSLQPLLEQANYRARIELVE
ncbi:cyclophilin-like fold protein [Devosia sp. CN2-171]|uniref:cyclophilin-like fold protein n=1 Tax=Devosia sp. CN2-171 TaxID=3400909 RepID=UPI003BF7C2A0